MLKNLLTSFFKDSLDQIMENYEPKGHEREKDKKKRRKHKKTDFEEAIENLLSIEKLIECSERGGEEDVEIIDTILENDLKKLLLNEIFKKSLIIDI